MSELRDHRSQKGWSICRGYQHQLQEEQHHCWCQSWHQVECRFFEIHTIDQVHSVANICFTVNLIHYHYLCRDMRTVDDLWVHIVCKATFSLWGAEWLTLFLPDFGDCDCRRIHRWCQVDFQLHYSRSQVWKGTLCCTLDLVSCSLCSMLRKDTACLFSSRFNVL